MSAARRRGDAGPGLDDADPAAVAPRLLGCLLTVGAVSVRLTEVEAYGGAGEDPGSHAFRGRTPRNGVMFGPPGHAYVYFTYGMHWCLNVVTGPEGQAAAVLLRAGEVVAGVELARSRSRTRRPGAPDRDLARGPARLARCLGVTGVHNGAVLLLRRPPAGSGGPGDEPAGEAAVLRGPRVGLAAGGERPWRFWMAGEPTVSSYRAARPRSGSGPAPRPARGARRPGAAAG